MDQPGRTQTNRHAIVTVAAALAAVVTWFVFHAVYVNLSQAVQAVGYVDSSTRIGIALGYLAMVGGTAAFAATALWSGIRLLLSLRRR